MKKDTSLFTLGTLILIVFICYTITPSLCMASDWQLFFENELQTKFYIDKSSVVNTLDGNIRAWKKTESKAKNGSLALYEINCRERKYTVRAMEPIDKNDIESIKLYDTVMRNWTEPEQAWEYMGTTDLDGATYKTWCNFLNEKLGKTRDTP